MIVIIIFPERDYDFHQQHLPSVNLSNTSVVNYVCNIQLLYEPTLTTISPLMHLHKPLFPALHFVSASIYVTSDNYPLTHDS
jgi:hypothetical protein